MRRYDAEIRGLHHVSAVFSREKLKSNRIGHAPSGNGLVGYSGSEGAELTLFFMSIQIHDRKAAPEEWHR